MLGQHASLNPVFSYAKRQGVKVTTWRAPDDVTRAEMLESAPDGRCEFGETIALFELSLVVDGILVHGSALKGYFTSGKLGVSRQGNSPTPTGQRQKSNEKSDPDSKRSIITSQGIECSAVLFFFGCR